MLPLAPSDLEGYLDQIIDLLKELVERESPTPEKAAVDRLGEFVAGEMRARGASVQRHARKTAGDLWQATWSEGPGGILLLAHLDTVHPLGTLERFPFRERGERLYGPGALDMKASVALALTAVEALLDQGHPPKNRVTLLCTSDEEMGSHESVDLIQDLAQEHEVVFCLEPALPDGSLKTWRKGVGIFRVEVHGKPAHAGANPGDGINAIMEMARLLTIISDLEDEEAGTTVNVGVIKGGTRSNVVPAFCRANVDMRVLDEGEQQRISQALYTLEPNHPRAELVIKGGWNRPPMPRSSPIIQAFEKAQSIAEGIGLQLSEGGTGGGSDANFVAPLDIPVLDGLGPVGMGAHTEEEYVLRGSLIPRTALLAALISQW